ENAEKEIEVLKFNTAFERAIESYNPRNPKALAALINKENVKLIDGNFIGLDEQMKAYQESDSYLFKDKEDIKIKIDGKPLDSLGSTTSSVEGSEKKSLGERLAAEKAEASKATETLDSFFK
ncbi:TPA: phage scaffolding protein, partial [Clostridioides difficile]|nr:phage scaffolding protein [Clostridioides difficile]